MTPFQRLQRAAKALGVKLERGEDSPEPCPFNHSLGIRWPNILVLDRGAELSEETMGEAIHEMGHICCTRDTCSNEMTFLGWEFVVAREFGLLDQWLDSMGDYCLLGDDLEAVDFGTLTPEEQSEALEYAVWESTESGFLLDGIPLGLSDPACSAD